MTNLINKITKNAILPLAVAGFFGLNYILAKIESTIIEKNNGKTMSQIQPWRTVYDDDDNGEADRTVVKTVGGLGGQYRVIFERKPTQEEVNWYKSN